MFKIDIIFTLNVFIACVFINELTNFWRFVYLCVADVKFI